jgi:hypothetical protein
MNVEPTLKPNAQLHASGATSPTCSWSHTPAPCQSRKRLQQSCRYRNRVPEANPPREHPSAARTKFHSTRPIVDRATTTAPWVTKFWNQRFKNRPQLAADFSSCHARHDTSPPRVVSSCVSESKRSFGTGYGSRRYIGGEKITHGDVQGVRELLEMA